MSKARIYLPLADLIDLEKTELKLLQRKQAIEKDLAKVEGTLANPDFIARAPQDKIDTIKSELNNFQQQMAYLWPTTSRFGRSVIHPINHSMVVSPDINSGN